MKILLDTNIWIRYIVKDNQKQFEQTRDLFAAIEAGLAKVYGSSIVFLEVNYVLKSLYRFKFEEIVEVMTYMRNIRDVTIIEQVDIDKALNYFKSYHVKFSDCLIASQLKSGIILVSFDEELKKIKEVPTQSPAKVLSNLKNLN